MKPSSSTRTRHWYPCAKTLAARPARSASLLLALVFLTSAAADAVAQVRFPPPQSQTPSSPTTPPPAADDDERESEDEAEHVRPRSTDPATLMRTARVVLVRSHTTFVNQKEVEDSLRKRKEFRAWGMSITRSDADADLIIEIERKSFSRRFTFSVLEPRTLLVVTSGKTRSVLFGKKIPNKIAEKFVNRLKTARPYPGD